MESPVIQFSNLWYENQHAKEEALELLREPGILTAFVFYPSRSLSLSDYAKLQSMHFLFMHHLSTLIDGKVPLAASDTLTKILLAAHGLGSRYGGGKIDSLGHTKPFKSRVLLWEQLQAAATDKIKLVHHA